MIFPKSEHLIDCNKRGMELSIKNKTNYKMEHRNKSMLKLKLFIYFFFFSTIDELTNKEFLMEVEYVWGKRPFWHGHNPQKKGEGLKAYWGWLEDWADPRTPPTLCYLGNSRTQVLRRIQMYSIVQK